MLDALYRLAVLVFSRIFELSDRCSHSLGKVCTYLSKADKYIFLSALLVACTIFASKDLKSESQVFLLIAILTPSFSALIQIAFMSIHSLFLSVIFLSIMDLIVSVLATLLTVALSENYTSTVFFILILFYYSAFWIFYTLIAEPHVAKTANEILACIYTFIYTLSTYFISLLSEEAILDYFARNPQLFSSYFISEYKSSLINSGVGIVKLIQISVGLFLPFLGLSALSIIIATLKLHWIDHYRLKY